MTTLNQDEKKASGRHFYATKPDNKGRDIAYAFNTMAERSEWIAKNENSKQVTAFEVYQMLNKQSNEILIANRRNRVMKVSNDVELDVSKGQRLIRS